MSGSTGSGHPFRLPTFVIGGVILMGAGILFWFEPSGQLFYPVCLFYRTTGLLCPGCGALRALHQLLHGHILTAFRFNALLMAGLPVLAGFGIDRARRKKRSQPGAPLARPFWLWLFLGAALVFSVLRNLPGPWFEMLRP